jgi:hypothetical protein
MSRVVKIGDGEGFAVYNGRRGVSGFSTREVVLLATTSPSKETLVKESR